MRFLNFFILKFFILLISLYLPDLISGKIYNEWRGCEIWDIYPWTGPVDLSLINWDWDFFSLIFYVCQINIRKDHRSSGDTNKIPWDLRIEIWDIILRKVGQPFPLIKTEIGIFFLSLIFYVCQIDIWKDYKSSGDA